MLRFFADDQMDRVVLINLGTSFNLVDVAQPLLAPPLDCEWSVALSTSNPQYGGNGVAPFQLFSEQCFMPSEAALVLVPERRTLPTR